MYGVISTVVHTPVPNDVVEPRALLEKAGALLYVIVDSLHVLSATPRTAYPLLELLFAYTRSVTFFTVPETPLILKRRYEFIMGEPSVRIDVDEP